MCYHINMIEQASSNLAANLKELRQSRRMSQVQLSKIAGIPRPTLANLESGSSNPTLSVLMRLAGALQVLIEELIAPPRSSGRHYRAAELPTRSRDRVVVRRLLPDPIPGLDIERLFIPTGATMVGVPHTRGTREYLTCESGTVHLTASGEQWVVEAGDVVVFRGDQRHAYRNIGHTPAVAYTVVMLAPGPG
jgi:transcriptional regulator with XRE-family HTH domain